MKLRIEGDHPLWRKLVDAGIDAGIRVSDGRTITVPVDNLTADQLQTFCELTLNCRFGLWIEVTETMMIMDTGDRKRIATGMPPMYLLGAMLVALCEKTDLIVDQYHKIENLKRSVPCADGGRRYGPSELPRPGDALYNPPESGSLFPR